MTTHLCSQATDSRPLHCGLLWQTIPLSTPGSPLRFSLEVHPLTGSPQVLSANPTDVSAPLILTAVRDGDPSQLWHQDHWRQFGNSTVTATLGMQDIDHLNKEAFVLINKATKMMLACGSRGEPMGLVDYAPGCDGPAVRKLILMEPVYRF